MSRTGDGLVHHVPSLLSPQCGEELAFEKALADKFPPLLQICIVSCLEKALCLLVACETGSSRKLQKYFMKCSNKYIHVVQPMQNSIFGQKQYVQFL